MRRVVVITSIIMHYRMELFERLAQSEELEILFLHGNDIKGTKFVNCYRESDLKRKELFTLQYVKGNRFLKINPTLLFNIIRFNPEVLLLEGEANMLNNLGIYLYCLIFRKPFIWWGLGLVPGKKETLYQRIYRPLKIAMLRSARYIIGYSTYSKEFYSQYVKDPSKILISFNCLDNEKIAQEIENNISEVDKVKEEYNLKGKKVLLFVGNLEKVKAVDRLIAAYRVLKEEVHELALLIIGKGACLRELQMQVEEYGLSDVHFLGQIFDNVSKYFLASDLFVLPGLGGLGIYHAMVHGLPVISASADGTEKDYIKDGYNGFLLKNGDLEELVALIKQIISDTELLKIMGENSKKIVAEQINIRHMVGTFETAILNSVKANIVNERINLMGFKIDNLNMDETVTLIDNYIKKRELCQHVVINASKVILANRNPELKQIINDCAIVNADGQSIVWAAKFLGTPLKERVAGIDLMDRLLELSEKEGYRVYFFGAREEVLQRAIINIKSDYPDLIIAGMRNGYFTNEEQEEIIEEMVESKADLLLIGFSSPKKEYWLKENIAKIGIPFCMGVGGSFDIAAGLTKRAPLWMQKTGLEWFYRLLQEPGRMWKRYVVGNTLFIYYVLKDKFTRVNR